MLAETRRCWKGKTVGPASSFILCVQKNWGIGDFGDLKSMLVDVATRGGARAFHRPELRSTRFIRRIRAPVPTAPRLVALAERDI